MGSCCIKGEGDIPGPKQRTASDPQIMPATQERTDSDPNKRFRMLSTVSEKSRESCTTYPGSVAGQYYRNPSPTISQSSKPGTLVNLAGSDFQLQEIKTDIRPFIEARDTP